MTEIRGNFPITVNISFGSFHKKIIWAAGSEIPISILLGLFLALFISIWGCIGFGDGASWGENVCTIGRVTPDLLFIFGRQRMNCTHKRRLSLFLSFKKSLVGNQREMREIVSREGFWDFWGRKANNTLTLLSLFNIIRVSAWRAWGRGCGIGGNGRLSTFNQLHSIG